MEKVIAIFDIGKTNKKMLLFDEHLNLVTREEEEFATIADDDGFACDDVGRIVDWMKKSVTALIYEKKYDLVSVNFSTYGATLAYLSEKGSLVTPLYNYLKPMPSGIAEPIYERYGGTEEFCRCTASPAMGMLNSGLQILWLKKYKPDLYCRVKNILHLPQYLSFCFTGAITSEYTSIGCHTALWNFDAGTYHQWLSDEDVHLPAPSSNDTLLSTVIAGKKIGVGIGIHDSSASLVPYLLCSREPFILASSGTWCIFMNPFNDEALTADQLNKDTLCYLSTGHQQVKSSRLFMGHFHDIAVMRIASCFNANPEFYRKITADKLLIKELLSRYEEKSVFFPLGKPDNNAIEVVDLSVFSNKEEAYHKLILDLALLAMDSIRLVIPENDPTCIMYVSGGFARNEIFIHVLSALLKNKQVYTSEIDNATALGAALSVYAPSFNGKKPDLQLKMTRVEALMIHQF